MWLSLVERCVRDAEAAGSNPVISTKEIASTFWLVLFVLFVTGFETTSKLCDQRKQRVWENSLTDTSPFVALRHFPRTVGESSVDCSIAGEENPVFSFSNTKCNLKFYLTLLKF